MFKIYREIQPDEYILVGGDLSQGGKDANYIQFFSATKMDFPIVYKLQGVAAQATTDIHPALEWIYDITGVKPVVAFERNNGGASEMERLKVLNRLQKYTIFVMPKLGANDDNTEGTKLGWNTDTGSRPKLLGEWKNAIDSNIPIIYDAETVEQHKTFIIGRDNKPQASSGFHDDAVISPAICWQLYQMCPRPSGSKYNYGIARKNLEQLDRYSIG